MAPVYERFIILRWRADQRQELEQLCRYITRPAITNERLKLNRAGQVVLQLERYGRKVTILKIRPAVSMRRATFSSSCRE
ncbi:MAG: transposase [Alphaproteobacteria bacterium]